MGLRCTWSYFTSILTSLFEWLKHSKKEPVCELCNTSYKFTKLYAPDMPSHLPISILGRKGLTDVLRVLQGALKIKLALFLWVIVLPFLAFNCLRVYTLLAESIPNAIYAFKNPIDSLATSDTDPRRMFPLSYGGDYSEIYSNLRADVVEGYVLLVTLVLLFFTIMIVRDWILQNDVLNHDVGEANQIQVDPVRIRANDNNIVFDLRRQGDRHRRQGGARRGIDNDLFLDLHRQALRNEFGLDREQRPLTPPGDPFMGRLPPEDAQAIIRELGIDVHIVEPDQGTPGGDNNRATDGNNFQENPINQTVLPLDEQERENNSINNNNNNNNSNHNDALLEQDLDDLGSDASSVDSEDSEDSDSENEEIDNQEGEPELEENQDGQEQQAAFNPPLDDNVIQLDMFMGFGPIKTLITANIFGTAIVVTIISILYFVPYTTGRLVILFLKTLILQFSKMFLAFCSNILVLLVREKANYGTWLDRAKLVQTVITDLQNSPDIPGVGFLSRVVGVSIGYALIFTVLAYYANSDIRFSSTHQGQMLERTLIQFINQGQSIAKVIIIIGIELVAFPIFCGMLLDLSFLPLIDELKPSTMINLWLEHPILSTAGHWAIGTSYMFIFALFVSMCRKIMRSGVLYFVRDPNDPNFHPINDVLERSMVSQLHKIGISAIIYSVLIVLCIGGVVYGMKSVLYGVLFPLNVNFIGSFSNFVKEAPLIILQTFSGFGLLRQFRKLNILSKYWSQVFSSCCSALRLSSFILNRPHSEEQGYIYSNSIWTRSFGPKPDYTKPITLEMAKSRDSTQNYFIKDGSYVRAPGTDSIPTKTRLKLFIPVSKDDVREDGRDEPEDGELTSYHVVYRPPHFRLRIFALLLCLWFFGIIAVLSVSVVPLIFGRLCMTFMSRKANDLICYNVGLFPVFGIFYTLDSWNIILGKIRTKIGSIKNDMINLNIMKPIGKMIFALTVGFIALPILLGLLVDLYIRVPLEAINEPTAPIQISLMDNYLYGALVMLLIKEIFVSHMRDSTQARMYRQMIEHGWLDYDLNIAFGYFIFPLILFVAGGLGLPLSLHYLTTRFVLSNGSDLDTSVKVLKLCFPAILVTGAIFKMIDTINEAFKRWEVRARDQIYLIGQRLENLD